MVNLWTPKEEEMMLLKETLGVIEGYSEGWIRISMKERLLFAKLLRSRITALENETKL